MEPDGITFWTSLYEEKPPWYRMPHEVSDIRHILDDPVWQVFRGQRLHVRVFTRDRLDLLDRWIKLWDGTDYLPRARTQAHYYLFYLRDRGCVDFEGTKDRGPTSDIRILTLSVRDES